MVTYGVILAKQSQFTNGQYLEYILNLFCFIFNVYTSKMKYGHIVWITSHIYIIQLNQLDYCTGKDCMIKKTKFPLT